jgi:nucleoside-triphosphatase
MVKLPLKVFLTGPPGVGKSTVLQRVRDFLIARGYKVGGVCCPEIRVNGVRVGFEIVDVASGRRGILAKVGYGGEKRVGKYGVNILDLTLIGVNALRHAVDEADIILIDEVGPMEMKGKEFQSAVLRVIEGQKPVVGVIHWRMHHPVVDAIKRQRDAVIFEVTPQNRENLHLRVLELLKGSLVSIG